MAISRRRFLAQTGMVLASSTILKSCKRDTESLASNHDWAGVRRQFFLTDEFINFGALFIASNPKPVRDAIEEHRKGFDNNPVLYLINQIDDRESAVLNAAAGYFNVNPIDIALTDSTTMGLGLVYNGLQLKSGQEILTTEHDYFVTHESLRLAAARNGTTIRKIALYKQLEQVTEAEIVDSIIKAITPATRVLAVTFVHSSTGLKLPLRAIGEAIKKVNESRDENNRVLYCVDGVHGFGVEDITMPEIGCDFFMAGCHKWLFGPRGTGIICGSERGWSAVNPIVPSFMDDSVRAAWIDGTTPPGRTNGFRMSPGGFKPYDHQWALAPAFEFHQQIGKAKIAARTHELNKQLKDGLASMSHIKLHTPRSEKLSAGITCFEVDGKAPYEVVVHLRERKIIATITPYATAYIRLAPCIYNTPQEVETVLKELRKLAV